MCENFKKCNFKMNIKLEFTYKIWDLVVKLGHKAKQASSEKK